MNPRKLGAEFLGTMWLVFGGCGSAVLAAKFISGGTSFGIGFLGVSFAFGLTVLTGAYAFGGISGGHFNPAVTIGLWIAKKCETKDVVPYILAQVIGGIAGAGVLAVIANGKSGFDLKKSGFATNGYGAHSPGGYKMGAAFVAELFLTAVFLLVILGATHKRAPQGFAPISIGLALSLIHLISIPVTNTSVNPARSLAPALFVGGDALSQVWLFWVAPIAGAILGGIIWTALFDKDDATV